MNFVWKNLLRQGSCVGKYWTDQMCRAGHSRYLLRAGTLTVEQVELHPLTDKTPIKMNEICWKRGRFLWDPTQTCRGYEEKILLPSENKFEKTWKRVK